MAPAVPCRPDFRRKCPKIAHFRREQAIFGVFRGFPSNPTRIRPIFGGRWATGGAFVPIWAVLPSRLWEEGEFEGKRGSFPSFRLRVWGIGAGADGEGRGPRRPAVRLRGVAFGWRLSDLRVRGVTKASSLFLTPLTPLSFPMCGTCAGRGVCVQRGRRDAAGSRRARVGVARIGRGVWRDRTRCEDPSESP
jgi:hypothetical protein